MADREYLISPWIRVWHWTNALLILTLGITGISVHFADPDLLLVEFSLAVRIHHIAGVTLIAAYLFFVVANIVSGIASAPPLVRARPIASANTTKVAPIRIEAF